MTDKVKLIEKIKKLLALASSPNEHEAQRAMESAQRLMNEHALEVFTQVDTNEREVLQEPYICKINSLKAYPRHIGLIVSVVSRLFGCECILNVGRVVKIVGFKTNIEITAHAVDCLLAQGQADYRKAYAIERTISLADGFWFGFYKALKTKFEKHTEAQQEAGLTVYDPVQEWMRKNTVPGAAHTFGSTGASHGEASGQAASIRSGMGAGAPSSGRLLS